MILNHRTKLPFRALLLISVILSTLFSGVVYAAIEGVDLTRNWAGIASLVLFVFGKMARSYWYAVKYESKDN